MDKLNYPADRVFKTAKPWRIFGYITCPVLIIAFVGLLVMPYFSEEHFTLTAKIIIGVCSLAMIALGVFGLIDLVRSKFVIATDRVYSTAELSDRELFFHEIKGFHYNDKYIFIEPLPEVKKKRIKISVYYGGTAEIMNWLHERYPDLKNDEAQREAIEILTEADYGHTAEQRAARLKKARKVSRILNITSIAASVWLLVYPFPIELALAAVIIFPILSIIVLKRFGGLIRIDKEDKSPYPSVFIALSIPPCILFLRAVKHYNFVSADPVWTLAGIVGILFTASIISTTRKSEWKKPKNWFLTLAIAIVMLAYGYGIVAYVNRLGDQSEVEVFTVTVASKRISAGKYTSYYVNLEPWGPVREKQETDVPKSLYDDITEGDEVYVYLRPGIFNFPWYTISRKSE